MRVLALSKAYQPRLKPELLAGGFPEIKTDGTPFTKDDFLKVQRDFRPAASQIADSIDICRLEIGYDSQGKKRKVTFLVPEKFILLPPSNESSKPADTKPAPGVDEYELKMEDFSDLDLVEVCNKLLSPAGAAGSSSQNQAGGKA